MANLDLDGVSYLWEKMKDYIEVLVPTPPSAQGNYCLKCSVDANGDPTFSWTSAAVVTQDTQTGVLSIS